MKSITLSTIHTLKVSLTSNTEKIWLILKNPTQILEVENCSGFPEESFEIPFDTLGDLYPRIVGTIHSHTSGGANLSIADFETFKNLTSMVHFIITKTELKAFMSKNRRVYNASETEISRFFEGTLF